MNELFLCTPKKNDNINPEFMFASDLKLPKDCTSGVRGLLTPFFNRPNANFIFNTEEAISPQKTQRHKGITSKFRSKFRRANLGIPRRWLRGLVTKKKLIFK